MRKVRTLASVLIFTLLSSGGTPASAQQVDFTTWLNDRLDEVVAAQPNQRGPSHQAEAPSLARNSTTLVDHASFSDLVGIAFNPPAFPRADPEEREATAQALTFTPYTILTSVLGVRPNDPFFYENRKMWRAVSFTLGFEEQETSGTDIESDRGVLAGVKIKVWNPREVDPSDPSIRALRNQLGAAGTAFGQLSGAIQDTLFRLIGEDLGVTKTTFINRLSNPQTFAAYRNLIGAGERRILNDLITSWMEPFVALRRQARAAVAEIRGAPQLALNVQGRVREAGSDELQLGLALDYGLSAQAHWTVNAGAMLVEATGTQPARQGANIASELAFQLRPASLTGPDPITLSVAAKGEFLDETDSTWRVQGKLMIPIIEGLSLPISGTWANRSEFIDEDRVVGRVGFTLDTNRLLLAIAGG